MQENNSRAPLLRTIAAYAILAGALVLFALQLRTLYTVPVYDSVRWGGDETWLMREFGEQASHGVMSYPESFGGAQRTDGVLAGSMWVDALIYGASGNLFYPAHDYVCVGRTVTALLALLLIASIYFILRKLRVSPLLAAASVLLMVASQGFVWATHSARYDLLTGLTLIWFSYYLSQQENLTPVRMFFAGIIGAAAICFSRHLLLLGLAASFVFLYQHRVWKRQAFAWAWVAGSSVGAVILSVVYFTGAGEFSLFGRGGTEGSYSFVLNQIPILRPFSRNVQLSNLIERFHLFQADAPGILIVIGVSIILAIAMRLSIGRSGRVGHLGRGSMHAQRFFLLCMILCILVWLLAEGSRPYYLFHIVPLLAIGGAIILQSWSKFQKRWCGEASAVLVLAIGVAFGAAHVIPTNVLGAMIARDQSTTLAKFLNETPRKSRILLDVAGLDRALPDTSREVLTLDMFQPLPEAGALIRKLLSNKIDYVILRSSPVSSPFEPGRALLPRVLDSIGEVRDSALGFFYDDGRNYDASLGELNRQGLDTLRLYRVHPAGVAP
ncbi:MAG TPA: hypothetical protein VFH95_04615 [Candidatus Kapabacteria bacterium]|nr:hypothetical protein [Candidatus Kapabacteria bacterium]